MADRTVHSRGGHRARRPPLIGATHARHREIPNHPGRGTRPDVLAQAHRALSATRQHASRIIFAAPVPELGGSVVVPDMPIWKVVVRTAHSPACGIVVIAGLLISAVVAPLLPGPPRVSHPFTQHSMHRHTPGAPAGAPMAPGSPDPAESASSGTDPGSPPSAAQGDNPAGVGSDSASLLDAGPPAAPDPELEAAMKDIDAQADLDQALASQNPAPPAAGPSCEPVCTDSNPPAPQQLPDQPPPSAVVDQPAPVREGSTPTTTPPGALPTDAAHAPANPSASSTASSTVALPTDPSNSSAPSSPVASAADSPTSPAQTSAAVLPAQLPASSAPSSTG